MRAFPRLSSLLATLCLTSLPGASVFADVLFRHDTFRDFSRGTLSDSGANLYISREGRIGFVNIFDLNADGFPEIVVNNDHNYYDTPDVLIYHNRRPHGLRSLFNPLAQDAPGFQNLKWTLESLSAITRLPAEGGGKAVLADLNNDGFPELLFTNFIHGSSLSDFPTYIYWGSAEGFDPARRSLLPADRASALAVADVNGDGLMDIVAANVGREHMAVESSNHAHAELDQIASPREKTSFVFYQTESGFTPATREVIPTLFAIDVKVADLDHSGEPSLLFLEMGKPGAVRIIRQRGGKWSAPELLPVLAPTWGRKTNRELLVKDLNGDGYPDLFVPSAGSVSEIFWSDQGRFSASRRTTLPATNAFSADAGDLNKDGYVDLVIASLFSQDETGKSLYSTDSHIWWGGKDGFSPDRRLALPTTGAVSVRLADVNQSGYLDILFTQHRNKETFDVPCTIYFNSADGFSPENRLDLQGFGTVSMLAGDLTNSGMTDVVMISGQSGRARHTGGADSTGGSATSDANPVPLYIYHGNSTRKYGTANLTRVPASPPETNLTFADMEDNGKTALVYLDNLQDRERRGAANDKGGNQVVIRYDVYHYPEVAETTRINLPFQGNTVNIADFNRDGILDALVTPNSGPQGALIFGLGGRKYRVEPFDFNHPAYACAVGDIDNDGVLDAITSGKKEVCILRGNNQGGFHFEPPVVISSSAFTARVSLADFNTDGWLDILCQNVQDDTTTSYDIESWVLVNRRGAFSLEDRRSFHTFGANGGSIARLKNDGKLDVIAANYHGDLSRRTPTFVLPGNEEGFPSDQGKQRLPSFSSGANTVMDLDGDGFQDIVVFNHTRANVFSGGLAPTGGEHGVGSFIYWGGKSGFGIKDMTMIASFGPHSRIINDPGSLSRRDPFEVYTSDYLSNRSPQETFTLTIEGRFNRKQYVTPEILLGDKNSRGDSPTLVPTLLTQSPIAVSYRVVIPKGESFRYRLKLNSSHSGGGPIVSSVQMESAAK